MAPASDTTAPTTPTNLTVTPGNGSNALSWTASTDAVGVVKYRIRRGGTVHAEPTGTSYTDTGLTNGTSYSYTVSAVDAAGNESAQTAPVTGTPVAAAPPPANTYLERFDTVGALPASWRAFWVTTGAYDVVALAGADGGAALRMLVASGNNAEQRALVWDTPGTFTDGEVVMKWRSGDTLRGTMPAARVAGSAGTTTGAAGYAGGVRTLSAGNQLQNISQSGGTLTVLNASPPATTIPTVDVWYVTRLQVSGTTIRSRTWAHGTTEPSTWDVEVTNTAHTTGLAGLYPRQLSTTIPVYVDWVGVATVAGTPAPVGG